MYYKQKFNRGGCWNETQFITKSEDWLFQWWYLITVIFGHDVTARVKCFSSIDFPITSPTPTPGLLTDSLPFFLIFSFKLREKNFIMYLIKTSFFIHKNCLNLWRIWYKSIISGYVSWKTGSLAVLEDTLSLISNILRTMRFNITINLIKPLLP